MFLDDGWGTNVDLFFINFSQHFVYMNTNLQPNLQYTTYDIIHMFMGENKQKNINKMLFSYIEKMSSLKTITKCEKRFSLYIKVPKK